MKLVSPLQEVVEVNGTLEDFAKENDLDRYSLIKLVEGRLKTNTYKGWKSYDLIDRVIDPEGNIHEILSTRAEFAKKHGITSSGITIMLKHGKVYRGWKKYDKEVEDV